VTGPAAIEQTFNTNPPSPGLALVAVPDRSLNTHHVFKVPLTDGCSAAVSEWISSFESIAQTDYTTYVDQMAYDAHPVLVVIVEGVPKP
jgi:hypothetical protein